MPAWAGILGDSAGARTQDPLLKRQMLYQLSYRIKKTKARFQDPSVKNLHGVLYQLSYRIYCSKNRNVRQRYRTQYRMSNIFPKT